MKLIEAIRNRVSVREFSDKPIPQQVIDEMLEAARQSPSGGNGQTYRLGVVTDEALKLQLAQAAGEQKWIAEAPLVIACCADISWDLRDAPKDDFGLIVNKLRFGDALVSYTNAFPDRRCMKSLFANATPLIPAEHMFLVAVSHGLSACFVGYLDTEKASRILKLPEHIMCLFLLPIGYPKSDTIPQEKKGIKEISFKNTWEGHP